VSRWPARIPLWVWWIPVVLIASFPLGLTATPQWDRIHLVPFSDPADKVEDLAANILLFVPFGYSFARDRGLVWLPLAAGLVSAFAELSQLFSTVRYPSGTDVFYAVVGALAGGFGSLVLRKRP
jgi:glycopeptide antibiotics resistance protein